LLRAGKEVLMDVASSSNPDDVRAYLRGPLLGGIFHQRGIAPLHASAVDVAGHCFAFVGSSGAGKSTLAAALAQRGHEVVADDECFIKQTSSGEIQASFGSRHLRLWEDSRAFLGFDGPMDAQEMQGNSKHTFPVRAARDPREVRSLRGVYQLCRSSDGPDVSRLRGADAFEAVLQN